MILKFKNKQDLISGDVSIKKIVGHISPKEFIKLLKEADNKVNPRIAKENKITKSIKETLSNESGRRIFWLKNRGILVGTQTFLDNYDRERAEIDFTHKETEGIMDGGHTTLAVAGYILSETIGYHPKNWDDCKNIINERFNDILDKIERVETFYIPIEIITPSDGGKGISDYLEYISEICDGRNNSVQLSESSKGNHRGLYDLLKNNLNPNRNIGWKTGDGGMIQSDLVIAFSCLPLIFLCDENIIETRSKLSKTSLYSQKSKCIDFYNNITSDDNFSKTDEKGKRLIVSEQIESSMSIVDDILSFFDKLYLNFPNIYNKIDGKFGLIKEVNKKETKLPFMSSEEKSEYSYPHGYIYPIVCALTELMEYDNRSFKVRWKINPNQINLSDLDFGSYIKLLRTVNMDSNKFGKNQLGYDLGCLIFKDYINLIEKRKTKSAIREKIASKI